MQIAIVNNGVVEQVGDYKVLFPHISFPATGLDAEWMAENNVIGVTLFKPYDSRTQKLVSVAPYVEGDTVYTVAVETKTQEELDADLSSQSAQVRFERNQRLLASDWSQGKDIPDSVSTVWATYREVLRNVPQQARFPWEVSWPVAPL